MPMDDDQLLQVACAKASGCSTILTHNIKDFRIQKGLHKTFPLPEIQTPEAFLQEW